MLIKLRYFVAVANKKSFTEAAYDCHLSQSAISQQIKSLEDTLGIKLINREKRCNQAEFLTPAGEYFYRQSIYLLDEFERITHKAGKIQNDKNIQVTIGVLHGLNTLMFQRAVSRLSVKYRNLRISIVQACHEALYDLIRNDKTDINFNDSRRLLPLDYQNFLVKTAQWQVALSRQNPLSELEKISFEELRQVPCILIEPGQWIEMEIQYYQTYHAFKGNYISTRSVDEAMLLATQNKGFFAMGNVQIHDAPSDERNVVQIPMYMGNQSLECNYYAFWKLSRTEDWLVDFAHFLREEHEKYEHPLP